MPEAQTAEVGGAVPQPGVGDAVASTGNGAEPKQNIEDIIAKAVSESTKDLRSKVNEFRDNTIAARKEVEQWNALGMPFEKVQEIITKLNASEEAKAIAAGKIDDVVASRIEPIRRDWESQRKALETNLATAEKINQEYRKSLFDLQIETQASQAVSRNIDIHPETMPTIVLLAKQVWHQKDDGTIAPFRPDGLPWKDGTGHDISFDDWIESLKEQPATRFLFKSPAGLPGILGGRGSTNVDLSKMNPEQKMAWSRQQNAHR